MRHTTPAHAACLAHIDDLYRAGAAQRRAAGTPSARPRVGIVAFFRWRRHGRRGHAMRGATPASVNSQPAP
jgi:hypothetical protein